MNDVVQFNKFIESGDLDKVEQALAANPELVHTFTLQPREWGDEMWLPLHRAAFHGHSDIAAALLAGGARPDSRTRFRTPFHARCTAMHFAAAGGYVDILEMLAKAGGEVNVLNTENAAPLHWACRYGRAPATELLLKHRAQLDPRDQDDRTPLHLAILGDHAEVSGGHPDRVVPILLESNANPNATCPREPASFTPLHRCVTLGLDRIECAAMLLKKNADPDVRDPRHKKTPVELAADMVAGGDATMQAYIDLFKK